MRDFIVKINWLQANNHEVIVKHVQRKLTLRKVLTGPFHQEPERDHLEVDVSGHTIGSLNQSMYK